MGRGESTILCKIITVVNTNQAPQCLTRLNSKPTAAHISMPITTGQVFGRLS